MALLHLQHLFNDLEHELGRKKSLQSWYLISFAETPPDSHIIFWFENQHAIWISQQAQEIVLSNEIVESGMQTLEQLIDHL